ncbi:MAG: nitroreductase family protein [Chloroflexota bacterium]
MQSTLQPTAAATSFEELIRSRRSLRRYDGRPVAPEIVTKVLEAASWAPSAHNRQPWRYCVVQSQEVKFELSQQMGRRWQEDLSGDGADPEVVARRVAISQKRMMSAGILVVPSVTMEEMDKYPDALRNEAEWIMAVQSVALSCQNLLLAVHQEGLGACWMCAPLFVPELVRTVLNLPDEWHPQALITVGYPAAGHTAADKIKERTPIDEWAVWR